MSKTVILLFFAPLSELLIPKAPSALTGAACSQKGFLVDPQLVV